MSPFSFGTNDRDNVLLFEIRNHIELPCACIAGSLGVEFQGRIYILVTTGSAIFTDLIY